MLVQVSLISLVSCHGYRSPLIIACVCVCVDRLLALPASHRLPYLERRFILSTRSTSPRCTPPSPASTTAAAAALLSQQTLTVSNSGWRVEQFQRFVVALVCPSFLTSDTIIGDISGTVTMLDSSSRFPIRANDHISVCDSESGNILAQSLSNYSIA